MSEVGVLFCECRENRFLMLALGGRASGVCGVSGCWDSLTNSRDLQGW
jgi:hypothetical protein